MVTLSLFANESQKNSNTGYFYIGLGAGWMSLNNNLTEESFDTYPLLVTGGYQVYDYLAIEGRYIRSILVECPQIPRQLFFIRSFRFDTIREKKRGV